MGDFGMIVDQVALLIILMAVGLLLRKLKILTDQALGGMSSVALYVAVPCTIMVSFQSEFSRRMLAELGHAFLWTFLIYFLMWLLGKKIFNRFPKDQQASLRFSAVFSNAAFMGYPVLEAVYGSQGLLLGAMGVAVYNIFLWTAGIGMYTDKQTKAQALKKVLLNPGTIATVLGLTFFVTSVRLPSLPLKAMTMLGNLTTPLSMMIVGARLGDVKIKEAFSGWGVYFSSILRLIVIPLFLFGVMKLCHVPTLAMGVVALQTAMPVAANTTLFAEMYGGDARFASRLVFLSTLLSVVTIPLLMLLIG